MNNLETDILKVLIENHIQSNTSITAKAVAETCMPWIEKAFIAGENNGHNRNYLVPADEEGQKADFKKFLKRNGLTPTEHLKQKEADQMDEELKRTIKDLNQ